ncbi:B3/4 domain-containing protein [Dyella flava]|uniref:B3/B4 tRNA-binding domain-containing protein n=1 Tax=Dyella flava TaxID=1920170 RepID=A0ABS2K236_9GAMM|nr:phenylalanine--tRNA ligase beta subunit-related protein [Dyella flava]MBM7124797.1 hypothetical protein [Dyella flava]
MQYPQIEIVPDVFSIFPDLQVFALLVNGYDDAICHIDIEAVHPVPADMSLAMGVGPLSELPIISSWREVYRTMGLKPSVYHASVESLLRRAKKGWGLWQTGLKHVDFYNGFSIRCYAPIGGYDMDKVRSGSIRVRMLDPKKDIFSPLGGQPEAFPLKPDIAVYAVENDIACWAFNHRDSRDYCLTETTRQAIFFSEANTIMQAAASLAAIGAMRSNLSSLRAVCSPCIRYSRQHPCGECVTS